MGFDYARAFLKLRDTESTESELKIGIIYSYEPHYHGWCTDGYDENTNETYALDYEPWDEWLGMGITKETLDKFESCQIVAHCLWEMTFVSFDETEIQAQLTYLKDHADELRKEK